VTFHTKKLHSSSFTIDSYGDYHFWHHYGDSPRIKYPYRYALSVAREQSTFFVIVAVVGTKYATSCKNRDVFKF